jgi:hypothetical protein
MGTEVGSEYDLAVIPEVADSCQDRGLFRWRSCLWEKILDEQSKDLALEKTNVDNCRDWSRNLGSFNWLTLENWLNCMGV